VFTKRRNVLESLDHAFALCDVGQQSQLELSVVCNNQHISWFTSKCFSDFVTVFVKRWLILSKEKDTELFRKATKQKPY
jgi:hypothetical protein